MSNLGPIENCELNIPSERAHSKLSEYHKIIEIGSTEVELWPLLSYCLLTDDRGVKDTERRAALLHFNSDQVNPVCLHFTL